MRVLGIDTAGGAGGLALVADGALVGGVELGPAGGHAERILDGIESLLEGASVAPADLDLVAVTVGPGSFTGIRIGIAAAQGIAFGIGKPVSGVTSLELLAAWAREVMEDQGGAYASLIDARRGEVYCAAWGRGRPTPDPVVPPSALPPEELAGLLAPVFPASPDAPPLVLVGDGVPVAAAEIARWTVPLRTVFPPRAVDAAALAARLGLARHASGRSMSIVEPLYIRPADARKPRRPPLNPLRRAGAPGEGRS